MYFTSILVSLFALTLAEPWEPSMRTAERDAGTFSRCGGSNSTVSPRGDLITRGKYCDTVSRGYTCQLSKVGNTGTYAPYATVEGEIPAAKPEKCKRVQVNYLSRHGARGVYEDTAHNIHHDIAVLKQVIQQERTRLPSRYAFLRGSPPEIHNPDLTSFGSVQQQNAGDKFYTDYKDVYDEFGDRKMLIRSSDMRRTKESAINFMRGFDQRRLKDKGQSCGDDTKWSSKDLEVVRRSRCSSADTLNYYGVMSEADPERRRNIKEYQRYANKRLGDKLGERLGIDRLGDKLKQRSGVDEIPASLAYLCGINSIDNYKATDASQWCDLYSSSDFAKYVDYPATLHAWYEQGPGLPRPTKQAVSWVRELQKYLAMDNSKPETPAIRADFSHAEVLMPIMGALDLYEPSHRPRTSGYTPPEEIDDFSVGTTVPMAGRLVVEKLECEGKEEPYVRFKVNDRVMEMPHLNAAQYDDVKGVYTLDAWQQSVDGLLKNPAKCSVR